MSRAVTVDHLSKRYGATVAVRDVSFEVAEGEIFGLLGPALLVVSGVLVASVGLAALRLHTVERRT